MQPHTYFNNSSCTSLVTAVSSVQQDLIFSPLFFHLSFFVINVCGSDCQFEMSGPDGLIRSSQVEEEYKLKPDQAVDCIWTIRAPSNNRVQHVATILLYLSIFMITHLAGGGCREEVRETHEKSFLQNEERM